MKKLLMKMVCLIILSIIVLTGCSTAAKASKMVVDSTYMLGTYLELSIWTSDEKKGQEIIEECFERISEIEGQMSVNIAESEVNKINDNSGKEFIEVKNDTATVLATAMKYAKMTNGAFDPTIGRFVKLWGIGTEHEKVPSDTEIAEVLKYVDFNKLKIEDKNKFKLEKKGMSIDLGGIAKGYAADEVAKVLKQKGIKNAIINLGGNILVVGKKVDGTDWKVGIQDPNEPTGTHMGVIEISDQTVVTSGNYERFFIENNQRYHHIIDPKTGLPTENGIDSATIITDSSADADALSTSVFVLGLEKGLELIESLEKVECIIITKDKEVYLSSGMKDNLTIINDQYKIVN